MGSLFEGTAWHYARYRPGYPEAFFADVVARFHLDGTGRLLDLGCGTGQLAIPLARHVDSAVGLDPEPEMLGEAATQAEAAYVTNVAWVQGSSADLPGELGRFRLMTMGRSFHWMDRERVLTALSGMVDADGGLVIVNDGCLVRPTTAWQHAIEDVQGRFLPPDWRAGIPDVSHPESHEELLACSPFPQVDRTVHEFTRHWSIDHAIGYLYSTSVPLRRLLGDRRAAFERAVTDALLAIDANGEFDEPVARWTCCSPPRPRTSRHRTQGWGPSSFDDAPGSNTARFSARCQRDPPRHRYRGAGSAGALRRAAG